MNFVNSTDINIDSSDTNTASLYEFNNIHNLDNDQLKILYSNKKYIHNKCVFACPGAGKTRLLISEICYLLKELNINPENIISISFTKKSAQEMKNRLKKYLEYYPYNIHIGTFHSVCLNIMRKFNYKNIQLYSIIDEHELTDVLKNIVGDNINDFPINNIDKKSITIFKRNIVKLIKTIIFALGVDCTLSFKDILKQKIYKKSGDIENIKKICSMDNSILYDALIKIYDSFLFEKKRKHYLYFDDILLKFITFLDTLDAINFFKNMQYLFVDEYQDVNNTQGVLLSKIYKINSNIIFNVVGDDAQSIYGFRGSEPKYIREFHNSFLPSNNYILKNNYRSQVHIVNLANDIINKNNDNIKKDMISLKNTTFEKPNIIGFDTQDLEAKFIVYKIKELIANTNYNYDYDDFAILSRTNKYTAAIELELIKNKIEYNNSGGLSILERSHVKDFMSFVILLINPYNEIQFRRILLMQKNVGEKGVSRIVSYIDNLNKDKEDNEVITYLDFILNYNNIKFKDLKNLNKYVSRLEDVCKLFNSLVAIQDVVDINTTMNKYIVIENILQIYQNIYVYIKNLIERKYDKVYERQDDILKLEYFFSNYEDLKSLLFDLHLLENINDTELDLNTTKQVFISTIHQSKGLEFKNVFMIGTQKCPLPISIYNDDELFEERRTFFVGVSRAIDHLYITLCFNDNNQFFNFSNNNDTFNNKNSSIFINEIDDMYVIKKNIPKIELLQNGNLSDIIKNRYTNIGPSIVHKYIQNLDYSINILEEKLDFNFSFKNQKLIGVMYDLLFTRYILDYILLKLKPVEYQKISKNLFNEFKNKPAYIKIIENFLDPHINCVDKNFISSLLKLSLLCQYGVEYFENNLTIIKNNYDIVFNIITKQYNLDKINKYKNFFTTNFIEKMNLIPHKNPILDVHVNVSYTGVNGEIDFIINDKLIEMKVSKINTLNSLYLCQTLSYNHMIKNRNYNINNLIIFNPLLGTIINIENNQNTINISNNIFNEFIKYK